MAFSTWVAHRDAIRNVLANAVEAGGFLLQSVQSIGPDGIPRTFRSLDEIRRYLSWVDTKVAAEEAGTTGRGRILFCGMVQ